MDAWQMTDSERSTFADLADSFDAAQWEQPSLCDGWKVRDVVAHVADGADPKFGKMMLTAVKYGFRMNVMNEREAQKHGAEPTDELRKVLAATVGVHKAPGPIKPEDMVLETIVHEQDVRRPLGIARAYPADEMKIALERATVQGDAVPADQEADRRRQAQGDRRRLGARRGLRGDRARRGAAHGDGRERPVRVRRSSRTWVATRSKQRSAPEQPADSRTPSGAPLPRSDRPWQGTGVVAMTQHEVRCRRHRHGRRW